MRWLDKVQRGNHVVAARQKQSFKRVRRRCTYRYLTVSR